MKKTIVAGLLALSLIGTTMAEQVYAVENLQIVQENEESAGYDESDLAGAENSELPKVTEASDQVSEPGLTSDSGKNDTSAESDSNGTYGEASSEYTIESDDAVSDSAPNVETAADDVDSETETEEDSGIIIQGSCGADVTYVLTDDGTMTFSGTGNMNNYYEGFDSLGYEYSTVPWCGNDYGETDYRAMIKKVVIESGITSIGDYMFNYTTGMTSIVIPDTVTRIGKYAFRYSTCSSLSIPSGLTELGEGAFSGLSGWIGRITIPSGLTEIPDYAFSGCSGLKGITLNEGITKIGKYAFNGCSSITSFVIPDSVTEIGSNMLSGCTSLTKLTIGAGITVIPDSAFKGMTSLVTVLLRDGITEIGNSAFSGCSSLVKITVPDSVTRIGNYAFESCGALGTVSLGQGLQTIGEYAFHSCGIYTIDLPDSLKTIGTGAFKECGNLTEIVIPDSVTSIGSKIFNHCPELQSVVVGNSVKEIPNDAFAGDELLESVVLGSSITSIGDYAFQVCKALKQIEFPDALSSLGWACFCDCKALKTVDFSNTGLTLITGCAFDGCDGLQEIIFGDNIETIGNSAFAYCTSLQEVIISDSVTTLEDCCFAGSNISSLKIGTGVTILPESVFYHATIGNLVLPDTLEQIGEWAFYKSTIEEINIPDNVDTIGASAFGECSLKRIHLPENLMVIQNGLFYGCGNLTEITIPESVLSVGSTAFYGCGSLESIKFLGDAPTFGENCFQYDTLTVTYPYHNSTWTSARMKDYGGNSITWKEASDPSTAVKITSQPVSTTVIVGETFSFKVAASGTGLTYLWQYSKDGGETWTDTTRTKDNYGTTATNALNGRLFRCKVTDADGNTAISDPATLTVKPAIEITSQTDAQTVNVGELYKFRVTAVSNTGSKLTYLWQYSKTLKGWTDTTRTVNNYGTYATVGVDGKYFRCKITDEAGNVVYSTPAMVRVLSDITITAQPTDTTVASGKRFYFTVTATGSSLTYLWQYSTDGGKTWIDTTRARNNYTTYAKPAMSGRMFRCVITDSSNNSVISEAGTLTVK